MSKSRHEPASIRAFDIGGTKIATALIAGDVVQQRRQVATPHGAGMPALIATLRDLHSDGSRHDGPVAIATTGLVRAGRLFSVNPDVLALPQDGFPLHDALAEVFDGPLCVLNDGHAAGWGEFRYGAGRGMINMAFMTVSTGIGGSLILNKQLHIGAGGLAGHIGQVLADPRGATSGAGQVGSLEVVASGTAIAAAAASQRRDTTSPPEVFAAATAGEDWADTLLDRPARAVARAICDLKALLDIDVAVVGGGVGLADGYLARVRSFVSIAPPLFRVPVEPAHLGTNAGLIGVADWAIQHSSI